MTIPKTLRLSREVLFENNKPKSPLILGSIEETFFPEPLKFSQTERLSASPYATKEVYPFIRKLPSIARSEDLPYDSLATFPGGINAFALFLYQNAPYPDIARSHGIKALVFLEFTVDEEGQLIGINTRESGRIGDTTIDYDFSKALSQALQESPRWKPAFRGNKPARQRFNYLVRLGSGLVMIWVRWTLCFENLRSLLQTF